MFVNHFVVMNNILDCLNENTLHYSIMRHNEMLSMSGTSNYHVPMEAKAFLENTLMNADKLSINIFNEKDILEINYNKDYSVGISELHLKLFVNNLIFHEAYIYYHKTVDQIILEAEVIEEKNVFNILNKYINAIKK